MSRKATRERPKKLETKIKTVNRWVERIAHYRKRILRILVDSFEEKDNILCDPEMWKDEVLETIVIYYCFLYKKAVECNYDFNCPFFDLNVATQLEDPILIEKFTRLHSLVTSDPLDEAEEVNLFRKRPKSTKQIKTILKENQEEEK
jgi:hypothetical protein